MSAASDSGTRLTVLAPAKINLFLHVGEQRSDSYHELESLVIFAEAADHLEFTHASDLALEITGPFARALARDAGNLVLKAARALLSPAVGKRGGVRGNRGAAIRLHKNLPIAAGLGGGSADAAAALRGLNVLWKLNLSEPELLQIAASIGSDVPACLLSRPCWMEGRGERVTATPNIPPLPVVLINPGAMLQTAAVFANLNARTGIGTMQPPKAAFPTLWDLIAYLDEAANDLEAPACRLAPAIDEALSALDREPGCALAQMSGSGATCFGLFHEHPFAAGAAERIAQDHPAWWVTLTRIASHDIGAPVQTSENGDTNSKI